MSPPFTPAAATIYAADSAPAGPTHKMYATAIYTETKKYIVSFMFCDPFRFVLKILTLFHADYFTVFQSDAQPFIVLALEFGTFDCSLLDKRLLAKSQILQDQITSAEAPESHSVMSL
jgi:hypothetical protein